MSPSRRLSSLLLASLLTFAPLAACDGDDEPAGPTPVVLATAPDRLESLLLSGTDVYFSVRQTGSTGGGLYAVAKAGGAVQTIYETSTSHLITIVGVDADSVYWLEWDGTTGLLQAADLAGGAPRLLATHDELTNAAMDATHVYFGYVDAGGLEQIDRVTKDGLTTEPVGPVSGGLLGLIVDDDSVYGISAASMAIWKLAKTGGAPAENIASEVDVYTASSDIETAAFAADADYLYYFARNSGGVTRVPKVTGEKQVLGYNGDFCADTLAVDATSVYWTCANGVVYRGAKAGVEPEVSLGVDTSTSGAVAVDATRVYWLSSTEVKALDK